MRRYFRSYFLILWVATLIGAPTSFGAGVVINEIMYHPPSTNLAEQWFELFNPESSPVDLSGWRITKGVQFSIPTGTILPADGYLVIAADRAAFVAKNPGVTNVVGGWVGSINNSIEISDASGRVINSVTFYSDGDWAVRRLGPVQYNHQGWEWFAEHDGAGASLELVNPALPNSYAQNWESNRDSRSTPGRANSVARTNTAPFVSAVAHAPVIPKSSDTVTITARILDEETSGIAAVLNWRVDGTNTFTQSQMFDDGAHNDGSAGDGIYTASIPPHPNFTIIEFFIQAADRQGNTRIYPAFIPPPESTRTANLLYQVDDGTYNGAQPVYRLIMTQVERTELNNLGRGCPDSDSDAAMNATWITQDAVVTDGSTTQLRYNADVRNRGHGTRQSVPHNYHVNIPSDRAWKNQTGINLNSQYSFSQILGSAVFRKVGLVAADSRAVQLRVDGIDPMAGMGNSFGSYAANEQYNNDLIKRSFPLDPKGNSYRGIRQSVLCDSQFDGVADLTWHGADWAIGTYTNAYFKQNNLVPNDWSDLIGLIGVLNETNGTTPATYVKDVERVLNVEEWMKYMAVNTLLDNTETSLANGYGDDYALYRGAIDPRFLALPYDMDSLMGKGTSGSRPNDGIFQMNALPVMARFMKTPDFAPVYYRTLKTLSETTFSSSEMNPMLDQLLGSFVSPNAIQNMKAFNASSVNYVLSQIPLTFTAASPLPVVDGYPRTTTASTTVNGFANAIDTRRVLVNGQEANWSAWQGSWTSDAISLHPGINTLLIQAVGSNNVEIARTSIDVFYDDGSTVTAGSTINTATIWSAANGPYLIANSMTIAAGATLTIEPGTTVFLGPGASLNVANGGRLIAEGTPAELIQFTRQPGTSGTWGGIVVNGSTGSPETRIAFANLEFNGNTAIDSLGGTLFLDHTLFKTTTHQYLSLDDSSFIVSNCYFPTPSSGFEPAHGNGGIKPGGHGIFRRNFFGRTQGYNDVIDFTGGNRPGQPIVHFINNVFSGASDDMLDLDGTDAWVEGNIFLHSHKNGSPDSSSAVSGGANNADTSEITILNNIFFDCDQAATGKEGNFFTLLNNTIIHQNHSGGLDTDGAVINVADAGTAQGTGMYLEGNIIFDAEKLVRNLTTATVTFTNNFMSLPWTGPGGSNSTNDPGFIHIPLLSETEFNSWEEAQILRQWLSLLPSSPAKYTGPNGTDHGFGPYGITISGEPLGTVSQNSATLAVGPRVAGSGIPMASWPDGSGYTHYKWRLDGGIWSAETPVTVPIRLTNLPDGPHKVEAVGKRDSGLYQDDPVFGADAVISSSKSWTVDSTHSVPAIRINEILAKNSTTLTNGITTPDLVELFNYGATPVDVSGMGLSGTLLNPYAFRFPAGTIMNPGQYLVIYADADTSSPGLHLGFAMSQNGDQLYLTGSPETGGILIDSITFGLQIADFSIGRLADGKWALTKPTFGSANVAERLGDIHSLRINEWLTDEQFSGAKDFIELYNPSPVPVELGSLFLSDSAGALNLNQIQTLSFIAARGWSTFTADGSTDQGANHLNFKLSPDVGLIILSAPDLVEIDSITYGPQRTDISEGRSPSGSEVLAFFNQPTPGAGNPGASTSGSITNVTTTITHLVSITNSWRYNDSGIDLGQTWHSPAFDDSGWLSGRALFDHGDAAGSVPLPIATQLSFKSPVQSSYYFRTHFNFTNSLENLTLNITHIIDDGMVVYLNGLELYRFNMPSGTISYSTRASTSIDNGSFSGPYSVPATGLQQGDNVLAVEVHQVNLTSTDVAMAVALDASVSQTNIVSNGSQSPVVVLNELLASSNRITNSVGLPSDWIEIYNPSTNAVSLDDLSLTDDLLDARKWVFASTTSISPKSFLVVNCDNNAQSSAVNTGFALNRDGGALYLFDAPSRGGALLDSVQYGIQISDYSIGRVPNGTGQWTLNTPTINSLNSAAGLASSVNLHINEWMANSSDGNDWFELYNSATLPIELSGLFLSDKLDERNKSQISPLSFIGTGADAFVKFEADSDPAAGAKHANFKLSAKGDSIGLFRPDGSIITSVTFGNQILNVSQGYLPDGSQNLTSFFATTSPGESNYLPIPNVIVNEVLTHTDPPLEDAIELYNAGNSAVDISGWFISNSPENLKKFQIPAGTIIAPQGYKVFYQYQFDSDTNSPNSFTFNSAHGDQVFLSASDATGNLTGFRAHEKFGAAAHGFSFGQVPTSTGLKFVPLSRTTFGADSAVSLEEFRTGTGLPNAPAKIGPVVINEIMYRPFSAGATNATENPDEEFIELQNITATPVPLFDTAAPTNTWRLNNAISYSFPANQTIAAGEFILLVDFDPADEPQLTQNFRSKYGVSSNVRVYGPYHGRLDNSGETIELQRPDTAQEPPHPDAGFVPYIQVDNVTYLAASPWPALAAGASLQKLANGLFGDDPSNWFGAAPTAGRQNQPSSGQTDTDHDGIPDAWEIAYGLNPNNATDGALDPDNDGLTNLQEYLAGTDPTSATSTLALRAEKVSDGLHLNFNAVAGNRYEVEFKNNLDDTAWQILQDVPAQAQSGQILVLDPITQNHRFYRVRLVF
jgi:hypothetical protein